MTTTYHYRRTYNGFQQRRNSDAGRFNLYSPFTLMILIALLFVFFLTASNGNVAFRPLPGKSNEVSKASTIKDPVMIYNTVVREADAIRSILQ